MSTSDSRRDSGEGKSVVFERGIAAYIMGIDGTWRCECTMDEVSEVGARLTVTRPIDGHNLREFFLLLSSTGLAFRRCQLARVNGHQINATFVVHRPRNRQSAQPEPNQVALL